MHIGNRSGESRNKVELKVCCIGRTRLFMVDPGKIKLTVLCTIIK